MKQQHELFTTNDNHNPRPFFLEVKKVIINNAIIDYHGVCKYDLDNDISITYYVNIYLARCSIKRNPRTALIQIDCIPYPTKHSNGRNMKWTAVMIAIVFGAGKDF